jgi:GT2 family glycosyltransferase
MNNAAAREAKGEVLLLLNNDVSLIESGWLREMVSHALRPEVGIVGAKSSDAVFLKLKLRTIAQ